MLLGIYEHRTSHVTTCCDVFSLAPAAYVTSSMFISSSAWEGVYRFVFVRRWAEPGPGSSSGCGSAQVELLRLGRPRCGLLLFDSELLHEFVDLRAPSKGQRQVLKTPPTPGDSVMSHRPTSAEVRPSVPPRGPHHTQCSTPPGSTW